MGPKKIQLLLVAGALIVFVLLFIAPRTAPKNEVVALQSKATSFENASVEIYLDMAVKSIAANEKKKLDALGRNNLFDSIASIWYSLKRPDIASHYIERSAKIKPSADAWLKAGNRYYYAVQFCEDKSEVPVLYQCAMRCFSKALTIRPADAEAKIMLASCYVEGSDDPMAGISLLKEVEKADSNNVKLQLAFAFFSVKSGQLDKAVYRFNKVLAADSTYLEAYLHLADVYERQSMTEKAIGALEKYAAKTPEVTARLEVNKYIQQLKTNTNK